MADKREDNRVIHFSDVLTFSDVVIPSDSVVQSASITLRDRSHGRVVVLRRNS